MLAMINDQAAAALPTEISPDPLEEYTEPQTALGEKLYVDQTPDQPGEEAAHADTAALQHCKILTNHGEVALIEIAKSGKRRFSGHMPKDRFPGVCSLLHGHLRDSRERPPILIERCRVANDKYLG